MSPFGVFQIGLKGFGKAGVHIKGDCIVHPGGHKAQVDPVGCLICLPVQLAQSSMDDLAVIVDGGHPLHIAAVGDLVALRIETVAGAAAGKQLLDMAGANMTVDLPAEILDRTAQNEMKLLKERLSRSGITLEQHCKNSRTTPEALEKDYRAQAESRIRFVLAARAIAEAENIVVHPEEVNAEYRRLSQLQDTPEADIRRVLSPDTLAAALVAQKVQRFLLDNADITTVMDPEKE